MLGQTGRDLEKTNKKRNTTGRQTDVKHQWNTDRETTLIDHRVVFAVRSSRVSVRDRGGVRKGPGGGVNTLFTTYMCYQRRSRTNSHIQWPEGAQMEKRTHQN